MEQPEATPPPESTSSAPRAPRLPPRPTLAAKLEKGRGRRSVTPVLVLALAGGFALLFWVRTLQYPWVEIQDPLGVFAVSFPEAPKSIPRPAAPPDAPFADDRGFIYGTSWEDECYSINAARATAPIDEERIQAILTYASEEPLQRFKDTRYDIEIKSRRDLILDGQPARELVADINRGSGTLVCRIAVVGKKHVIRLVTAVHAQHHGENDARFLESFRLLSAGSAAPR